MGGERGSGRIGVSHKTGMGDWGYDKNSISFEHICNNQTLV